MKAKNILTVVLLLFVAVSVIYAVARESGGKTSEQQSAEPASGTHIMVHYFYGNQRCDSCRKIESYTKQTLKGQFGEQLEDGTIIWKPVNVEDPGNEHYVDDYQLTTRSVVLVRMVDGEVQRWKNLDQVWNLLDDQGNFMDYIVGELKTIRQDNTNE